jgi:hypothetical protein
MWTAADETVAAVPEVWRSRAEEGAAGKLVHSAEELADAAAGEVCSATV